MVLNVGRRFWRRTEAEFDCPESVTFVKHTCREVLLMRMEFNPKWGYLLGNVDKLCSPPLAPFERVDLEPVDIGPLHSQVRDVVAVWHRSGIAAYTFLPTWQAFTLEQARRVFDCIIRPNCEVWVGTLDERVELTDVVIKHPTHQASWTCARATSGHAAALPSPAINSRRRMRHPSEPLHRHPIPAEDARERPSQELPLTRQPRLAFPGPHPQKSGLSARGTSVSSLE
jgi:hypothetical protein